jgi:hypothetical protein
MAFPAAESLPSLNRCSCTDDARTSGQFRAQIAGGSAVAEQLDNE